MPQKPRNLRARKRGRSYVVSKKPKQTDGIDCVVQKAYKQTSWSAFSLYTTTLACVYVRVKERPKKTQGTRRTEGRAFVFAIAFSLLLNWGTMRIGNEPNTCRMECKTERPLIGILNHCPDYFCSMVKGRFGILFLSQGAFWAVKKKGPADQQLFHAAQNGTILHRYECVVFVRASMLSSQLCEMPSAVCVVWPKSEVVRGQRESSYQPRGGHHWWRAMLDS